jgi:FkbM family methyltransferase
MIRLGLLLVVAFTFCLGSYQVLVSPSRLDSDVDLYLQMMNTNMSAVIKQDGVRPVLDDYLSEISGEGFISCHESNSKVDRGEWHDPNDGRLYARRMITEPHFYASVHDRSYDLVRWEHLFEKGAYYEDEVHSRFMEILSNQPSSLVLDVGANVGFYTLLSASLGHHVIGFEINPANLLRICESLRLNDWNDAGRVAIFQRGVSNVHGAALQVMVPKNPGQAFMREIEQADISNETSTHHAFTTTVTLDAFAQERGWFEKPDLSIAVLKLDVEGKEPQIIEGATRLLMSGIVKNILTEFRRLGRDTIQTAIKTLLDTGYTLVHMNRRQSRAESEKILDELKNKLHGKMTNVDLWFQRALN